MCVTSPAIECFSWKFLALLLLFVVFHALIITTNNHEGYQKTEPSKNVGNEEKKSEERRKRGKENADILPQPSTSTSTPTTSTSGRSQVKLEFSKKIEINGDEEEEISTTRKFVLVDEDNLLTFFRSIARCKCKCNNSKLTFLGFKYLPKFEN